MKDSISGLSATGAADALTTPVHIAENPTSKTGANLTNRRSTPHALHRIKTVGFSMFAQAPPVPVTLVPPQTNNACPVI